MEKKILCPFLFIDVKIYIAINREELKNRNICKLACYAIKQGHILAFRFHRSYDTNFNQLSPPRMAKQRKEMRQILHNKLQYDLPYVYIPFSDDALTDQTKAIEDAGFTVFGASMDCPKIYWNNRDQMQPSQFVKVFAGQLRKGLGQL